MNEAVNLERIQKVLSRIGVASRRRSELLILAGRLKINGCVATLGDKVDVSSDKIYLDDVLLDLNPNYVTYLLNKPKNVVSTLSDPQGRKKVSDFVPKLPRVYPVGRLDFDSIGLILLTNEGDLAYQLSHPSGLCEKTYVVRINRSISEGDVRKLRSGILLENKLTLPAKVQKIDSTILKIKIREGRNRQIRRMLDQLGYEVTELKRTAIGPINDADLPIGQYKILEFKELNMLRKSLEIVKPN